jgi:xylulokinase
VAYCPEQGKVVARASVSYELIPTTVAGRAEQDPDVWMQAVDDCFQSIGAALRQPNQRYKIAGMGVSGQQHGMVALSAQREPLRPAKLWCDVEAVEETAWLKQQAKEPLGIDRSFLTAGFTAPKILWMKTNEPDLFAQTKWFVLPHDYVTMKLTTNNHPQGDSRPITDAGDASGNGLMDPSTRTYSSELADLIDPTLLDKLPTIVSAPNAIVGHLNVYYRNQLGVHEEDADSPNKIPISVGSGDNMCSALGVGCVAPGQAVLSLGTSGTLFGVSETPVPLNTPVAPFCDATGRHLPLACTMSCTGVLTQVLKEWCPPDWTHERASHEASKIEPGCYGISFLPYLGGERTPNWPHATGALLGLTPANMRHAQNPAVLYRACMEGITFVLADVLQYFPPIDTLLVVGGGAKNTLWQQMIADVLNCRLVFPLETESAALGAAFQAGAAATGTDVADYVLQQTIARKPDVVEPKNHQAYQEAFRQHRRFGKALFDQES